MPERWQTGGGGAGAAGEVSGAARASRALPAGSWPSPLSAASVASAGLRLADPALDGEDAWWAEGRPREGGRVVLVRHRRGVTEDRLPAPFSARSRVHEYGGGAFAVRRGSAWFVNDADQRVYELSESGDPRPLTPPDGARYGALVVDPARRRLLAVRERAGDASEPENDLVAVDLEAGGIRVLARGHDFYAAPCPSPDGRRLAFLAWDHPHMPWRGARLWLADLDADGLPRAPRAIAGDGDGCSACQPAWAPDGSLWYVDEPRGWWNLHRHVGEAGRCVMPVQAEFGAPLWSLGGARYGFLDDGRVLCVRVEQGATRLAVLENGRMSDLAPGLDDVAGVAVAGDRALLLAGSARLPLSVLSLTPANGRLDVLRTGSSLSLDDAWLPPPEPLVFPSGAAEAHGLLYRPANPACRLAEQERPPLIVVGHGGPTGAASRALDPRLRFWTSRGIAVLDLDYRGSTGYGRAYRDSLAGGWGVVDVEDAVAGASWLAAHGAVDGARMAIRGSSAGGYLALAAVAFHDLFAAASVWYGISDLAVLARDTHKFESRYLDWLVGPWPAAEAVYRARSPLHHAGDIRCPLLLLQGAEDRVVPPAQAEALLAAARARGGDVDYRRFEGEGHGFRRAETLQTCLSIELAFYGRVFGFEPASADLD